MPTTIDYALLAGAAYFDTRSAVNRFSPPQSWNVISRIPSDPLSGFEASAFKYGTDVVISFAGTDPNNSNPLTSPDGKTNAALASGNWADQLLQAAEYYLQIKAANPSASITLTGHSLGGGLAALVGVFFGVQATTFDQAPFAESALDFHNNNAADLRVRLATQLDGNGVRLYDDAALTGLTQYLQLRSASTVSNFIPRADLINIIRVDGEFLDSGVAGAQSFGTPVKLLTHGPANWFLSGFDLHSQALLTAFLQSTKSAAASGNSQQTLSEVSKKLPDLLSLLFAKTLFATNAVTQKKNFLDNLVRHEAGVEGAIPADGMVTRFTADLWKLAQDGGLTMTDGNPGNPGLNAVSKALTAFAMQMYYEDTANSTNPNKHLFKDVTGGVQLDLADVSAKFAAAFQAGSRLNLADAKGFQLYFKDYLTELNVFSLENASLIRSALPSLRDWYVQAGTVGLTATDTLNRGAFMLGGVGNDALKGGSSADLLVGNASGDLLDGGQGADTLIAGAGNETLIGGTGNDTLVGGSGIDIFQFTTGDGKDALINGNAQSAIVIDGATLSGGKAVVPGGKLWKSADGKVTYSLLGVSGKNDLEISYGHGDNVTVKGYSPGVLGIALQDGAPIVTPNPANPTLIAGTAAGPVVIDGVTYASTLFLGDDGNDLFTATGGFNNIVTGRGNSVIVGSGALGVVTVTGDGNNKIYAGAQTDVATALAQAKAAKASGQRGDFFAVANGNNTIVGGTGNDEIDMGTGNNLVVAGPGKVTVEGGVAVYRTGGGTLGAAAPDWSDRFVKASSPGGVDQLVGTGFGVQGLGVTASASYTANRDKSGKAYGTGNDTIFGGSGDSVFVLSNGDNYVDAGGGNDNIFAGSGNNTIFGGTGNSTIRGGGGSNYIAAESGNDLIACNGGHSTVFGGSGNSTIYSGDTGTNWATSKSGNNYLAGGTGDAILYGSSGNDTLVAGSGNDTINAGSGNQTIIGGAGSDQISGGAGVNLIDAGDGGTSAAPTQVQAGSGATTIHGGAGIDHIFGGSGANVLYAGDGGTATAPTEVTAGSGSTTIFGGLGVDHLFGGSGANVIHAGDGGTITAAMEITVGTGATTVYGGSGIDHIVAGSGTNLIYAGDGGVTDHQTYVTAGAGDDTLVAGAGVDVFYGGGPSSAVTYEVDATSGTVGIFNMGANDVLRFGSGIAPEDLTVSTGLAADGVTHTMTLQAGGTTVALDSMKLKKIAFADNRTLTANQLLMQSYVIGNNVVPAKSGASPDTQYASTSTTLDAGLTKLTLTGTADIVGTGNDLANLIVGNSGNDTLIAGTGIATLIGGTGNTTFIVNNTKDVVLAPSNAGHNTVLSSVSYVLSGSVNNLTLTGSAALTGVGGAVAGVITANSGNDTLVGGSGNDTLVAGSGADVLRGGAGATTFQLRAGGGPDTIIAGSSGADSIAFGAELSLAGMRLINTPGASKVVLQLDAQGDQVTLGSDFASFIKRFSFADGSTLTTQQFLAQVPNNGLSLTGNGTAAILTGGSGDDTLDGGSGNATLIGGAGKDTYVLGRQTGTDTVIEEARQSSVMALGAGVALADLRMLRLGNDLRVAISGTAAALVLSNYFSAKQSWTVQTTGGQAVALDNLVQSAITQQAALTSAQKIAAYQATYESAMRANIAARYGAASGTDGVYSLAAQLIPTSDHTPETAHTDLTIASIHTSGNSATLASQIQAPVTSQSTKTKGDYTLHTTSQVAVTPPPTTSFITLEMLGVSGDSRVIDAGAEVSPVYAASNLTGFLVTQHFPTAYQTVPVDYTSTNVTQTDDQVAMKYQIETIDGSASNGVIRFDWGQAPNFGPIGSGPSAYANYFDSQLNTSGNEIIHAGAGDVLVTDGSSPFDPSYEASTLDRTVQTTIDGKDLFGVFLNPTQFRASDPASGDFIQGGSGNDTLLGSTGGDMIIPGNGDNFLNGGAGSDTYVALPETQGWSVIYDSGQELTPQQQLAARTLVSGSGTFTYMSNPIAPGYGPNLPTTFTTAGDTYVVSGSRGNNGGTGWVDQGGQWVDYGGTWVGYDTAKMPQDTLLFDAGIKLSDLQFSWGVFQGASLHQTLNIGWGHDSGFRVAVANDQDTAGFGIEQFQFGDGTMMSLAQIMALAPPKPSSFDARPTLTAAFAEQTVDAAAAFSLVIPGHSFLDQNTVDTVQYSVQMADGSALASWLAFDPLTRTLSKAAAPTANGAVAVQVSATDSAGLVASTVLTLNVVNAAQGFSFAPGMGHQILPAGQSTILFAAGITAAGLSVTRDGIDLVVSANKGADVLKIPGWYASAAALPPITGKFADGSAWDTAAASVQGLAVRDTAGNTTLMGLKGFANVLTSGLNDTLFGGGGHDTYVVNAGLGAVHIAATGLDNTLRFGSGISADKVSLGLGSLLLRLDDAGDVVHLDGFDPSNARASGAIQSFEFADGTVLTYDQLLARGFDIYAGSGDVRVSGTNLDNRIYGGPGNDTLVGSGANDSLVAGSGLATLIGGSGNETFVVNNTGDVVTAQANAAGNTILASVSYVLPDNVSHLTLTGTASLSARGNALSDVLTANSGNDTLIAGTGIATLIGGSAGATFVVNNALDVVRATATGVNVVQASSSYAAPANVQTLSGTGSASITLTGGAQTTVINANSGNDTLVAGAGTATVTLNGAAGSDTFVVSSSSTVVNARAGGVNTLLTSVSNTAPANVQNITGTGTANLTLTGNSLVNVITANSGSDTLVGGSGMATMIGGSGGATFVVNNVSDIVQAQAGATNSVLTSVSFAGSDNLQSITATGAANLTLAGSNVAHVITANAGNDTLVAGSGMATLVGGVGSNTFVVNNSADVVVGKAGSGIATVVSSVSFVLPANVQNLTLTGSADLTATGNDLSNVLTANGGNDSLVAGAGIATLIGGAGNDVFVVNNAADVVHAQAGGVNTVQTSVSYTAPANVQKLAGTGRADLVLTGNGLNNVITANSGNDTLVGAGGNDTFVAGAGNATLIGGVGDDTYVFSRGNGHLKIVDAAGHNSVQLGTGFSLQNVGIRLTTATGVPYPIYSNEGGHDGNHARGAGQEGGNHGDAPTVLNAHLQTLDAHGVVQSATGIDFTVTLDHNGAITSPLQTFKFADGSSQTFDAMLISSDVVDARNQVGPVTTGRNDSLVYAGDHNTGIYTGSGNDTVYSSAAGSLVYAGGGSDYLVGSEGRDTLVGGWGVDVLQAGSGAALLSDVYGAAALIGGKGADTITGGGGNDFIAGGGGDDLIATGATHSVVAFNGGDGHDTLLASPGAAATLSLGKNIRSRDLSFSKNGADLVLRTGEHDGMSFKDWYLSAGNHDVATLQMIQFSGDNGKGDQGDQGDSKALGPSAQHRVEQFDFGKLVDQFDQARLASPTLSSWALSSALLTFHLGGSDSAAIGGELAYQYGATGNLSGVSLAGAQQVLTDPQFGTASQPLQTDGGKGLSPRLK